MTPSDHANTSGPTMIDKGGDGRNEGSSDNSTGSVGEMKVIRSFRTLVELLPGLELERGVYHVIEPLLPSNLQRFASAAKRVEDLTLTDAGNCGSYRTISSDTIVRLAVQDAQIGFFFSSLRHLRLVDADMELDYLWLCLVPSIRILEISGLKQNRQTTISTFLKELTLKSPQLETIILGPCSLPEFNMIAEVLTSFRLRRLEICNFSESFKFTDLKAISVLPYLEAFIVEISKGNYTSCDLSEPLLHANRFSPFPKLVYLSIEGDAVLICDLVFNLFPRGIKELSLTLIHGRPTLLSPQWVIFNMPHWSNSFKMALLSNPRISGRLAGQGTQEDPEVPFHTFLTTKGQKRICHGADEPDNNYICNRCSSQKDKRIVEDAQYWFMCFSSAVNRISILSAVHISVLRISCRQIMEKDAHTAVVLPAPVLPHNTLLRLLYSSTLVTLEIEKWELKLVDEVFRKLSELPERQMKYEAIYLPLERSLNDGIELTTLSLITQLYPRLLSFQSRFNASADNVCDLDTLRNPGLVLSAHDLLDLQVSGTLEQAVGKEVEIASYIYFLFPNLREISAQREANCISSVWVMVDKLLKMCHSIQDVRGPEKHTI